MASVVARVIVVHIRGAKAFGDILTGIILFFIIGCEFFITYKLSFRKAAKKEEGKDNV